MIGTSSSGDVVLITGGAGFIGSHLAEVLLSRGHRVRVIDDLSTGQRESIARFEGHPGFSFRDARLEDEGPLDELAEGAAVIFHLAATVGVRLVMEEPVRAIENNLAGSRRILRCALANGSRVVVASSSEVYGKGARVPFREDQDVLLGASSSSRWSYAVSKLAEEFLGLAYHRQHDVEVVVARLFNTIGPRQTGRYGMVVPTFVRQALAGEPITVYGDGMQTRSFCDVLDVVEALLGLAVHPKANGVVFNLGGGEEISIGELALRVKELTGSDSEIVQVPYEEVYGGGFEDLRRRVPDTSRAEGLLGWQPRRSLGETLATVIEHQRERADRQGVGEPLVPPVAAGHAGAGSEGPSS